MADKIHVFEKAGLGIAPFRFVGFHVDRGPHKTIVNGIVCETGSAGQPMGTCDYCGTAIANCCEIESSDGKRFIVGTDCVAKTGDKGLKAEVDKLKVDARHEREDRIIAEGRVWIDENRAVLDGIQYGRYTLLNSLEWYYKNAGRSGKMKILRAARKLLAAKLETAEAERTA